MRTTSSPRSTILCVDDQPDTLAMLRVLLSAKDFEVVTAPGAAEALQLIAEHPPDLIITDFVMPGMTGIDLCRALRRRERTRRIPIILYTSKDVCEEGPNLFDRFVLKPADLDTFVRTIRSLLSAPRARQAG